GAQEFSAGWLTHSSHISQVGIIVPMKTFLALLLLASASHAAAETCWGSAKSSSSPARPRRLTRPDMSSTESIVATTRKSRLFAEAMAAAATRAIASVKRNPPRVTRYFTPRWSVFNQVRMGESDIIIVRAGQAKRNRLPLLLERAPNLSPISRYAGLLPLRRDPMPR